MLMYELYKLHPTTILGERKLALFVLALALLAVKMKHFRSSCRTSAGEEQNGSKGDEGAP